MPIIRRSLLFPERARHHAEHRTPVESERAIVKRRELEVSERPRVDVETDGGRRSLLQLDKHAMRRRGVDERDQGVLRAGTWLLVDQPHPTSLQLLERGTDVIETQRDVMEARTTLLDVPGNDRVVARRFKELQRRLACGDEVRQDTLA